MLIKNIILNSIKLVTAKTNLTGNVNTSMNNVNQITQNNIITVIEENEINNSNIKTNNNELVKEEEKNEMLNIMEKAETKKDDKIVNIKQIDSKIVNKEINEINTPNIIDNCSSK